MQKMSRVFVAVGMLVVSSVGVVFGANQVIGQKGRLFRPGAITVKAGDTLTFQNDDAVTHHVYSSTQGQEFKLETVGPGKEASHTFSKKGRVDVRCGLHPGMRLVVTVE